MAEFFIELSIIILAATILGLITRIFKQPLILAYVITGILLGPVGINLIKESESITLFSQIGVALLLFIVGINLSTKHIKEIGRISLITGVGQVIFTSIVGYFIGLSLGFSILESVYISIALTFSSTIIIVKLLADKGDLDSLYGRIAIGFLIVQDFIAIFTLILLSGLDNNQNIANVLWISLIKGLILIIGLYIFYKFIVKYLLKSIAKTNELLLLASITWCFIVAAAAIRLGFSLEIGAFLAGIALANSEFKLDISAKVRPLRDFFIAVFFINLGLVMIFDSLIEFMWPIIIFSLFVLIGNPLIVFILMIIAGYRSRTSFLSGLAVAQISEFSLILIALGFKLGHISKDAVVLVTTVGLITITGSTYLIMYGDKIYKFFSKYLRIFERKNLKEKLEHKNIKEKYDIIMFGCHRMGFGIISNLKNYKIIIVDFDPVVISKLKQKGIKAVYADVNDSEVLEELALLKTSFVISTITNPEINKLIIRTFRRISPKTIIFVSCKQTSDCLDLYKEGSDFVAFPEVLAAQKISDYIIHLDGKKIKIWGKSYKNKFLEDLREGNMVF